MSKFLGQSYLVVAALVAALEGRALAVELHWQAPPECPSGDVIARDVTRLAGAHEGKSLVAHLVVTSTADNRWRVTIALSGSATGHRELTADNCAQLSRAAALIVALAANPEATLDLPTEEPIGASPKTAALPTHPNDSKTTASSAALPEVSPPVTRLAAQNSASTQPATVESSDKTTSPKVTWGPVVGIGYDRGSLPLGTGLLSLGAQLQREPLVGILSFDVTQSAQAEFAGGFGAKFRSVGTQLLGCFEPIRMPLRASACAGPRIDVIVANGYGTATDFKHQVLRPAGVIGTHFAVDISSGFQAGLAAEMLVFARRPRFVVENVDALLFQPPAVGLRVVLNATVRL